MTLNSMNIINRKQIYTALLLLPYFFAVTGMLVLDSGDKKMIPLFLISIIVSILVFKKETILKNIRYPFMWLIITSCLYAIFSYYYHGASSREIRALIGTTLFLLVFPYKLLTMQLIRWIILVGGFAICFNSIYFNVYMGVTRDAGYMNPIPYATTSALLAIISFALLLEKSTLCNKALPLVAFLLYLPPIVLSETRGVWLAFTISFFILIIIKLFTTLPTKKQLLCTIIVTTISVTMGTYLFKNQITERYNSTIHEIEKIKSNDYNTSFGLRLQMWELTPELFKNKPFLGHGRYHEVILKDKLNNNLISNSLYHYASRHYHNQFLDKMVKSGAIGLVLVISLLAYPLIRLKYLQENEKHIVLGSTYLFFIAGLTDVPFNHPQPLILYLLFLVPICSRCKRTIHD